MSKGVRLVLMLTGLCLLAGCAGKIPHALVPDFDKRGTRTVAVLPVAGAQADEVTASVLRAKLVEELYFKGYPRVPLKWIDERLATLPQSGGEAEMAQQRIGQALQVDALLYTTLRESPKAASLLYTPVAVEAEFELKNARTGESLWRVRHSAVSRNFGLSRKSLELKASQDYEPVIEELLKRVLETLPDGPDAVGA